MGENPNSVITFEALEALRKELRVERTKSTVAIAGSLVSIIFSGVILNDNLSSNVTKTTSSAVVALAPPPNQSSYPEFANFLGITAKSISAQSIEITNANGIQTAELNANGITFYNKSQVISFYDGSNIMSIQSGTGMLFRGPQGASTGMFPGEVDLIPASPEKNGSTSITPGLITVDTPQRYSIYVGSWNSNPMGVGVDLLNDAFDKAHAGANTIDHTSVVINPENIYLTDSAANIRTSIGETSLTTPSTGATSTTATSSITLFDKSGHVLWEAPQ